MSLVCTSWQKPHETQDKPTGGFNNSTHIIILLLPQLAGNEKHMQETPPPQQVYKGTFS